MEVVKKEALAYEPFSSLRGSVEDGRMKQPTLIYKVSKKLSKEHEDEQARREQELSRECTFMPTTRECPSYVRRIAKSMAIVREAREKEIRASGVAEKDKPQWK